MKLCCMNNCECLYNAFSRCWSWFKKVCKSIVLLLVLLHIWLTSASIVGMFDGYGVAAFEIVTALIIPLIIYCKCKRCNDDNDCLRYYMIVMMMIYLVLNIIICFT